MMVRVFVPRQGRKTCTVGPKGPVVTHSSTPPVLPTAMTKISDPVMQTQRSQHHAFIHTYRCLYCVSGQYSKSCGNNRRFYFLFLKSTWLIINHFLCLRPSWHNMSHLSGTFCAAYRYLFLTTGMDLDLCRCEWKFHRLPPLYYMFPNKVTWPLAENRLLTQSRKTSTFPRLWLWQKVVKILPS